jgi:HSP20 family protein
VARIFLEMRNVDEDLRGVFDGLGGDDAEGTPGETDVPLDAVETDAGLEIVVDLPGVTADAVQVLIVRNTLVVVGRKLPFACQHREAAFHLAERTFGRFARAVRLAGAFDAGRAEATLRAGELRVTLPRIEERRGRELRIPVRAD